MGALSDVSKTVLGEVTEAPPPQQSLQGSPVMKYLQESQERSQEAMAALDARRRRSEEHTSELQSH